MAIPSADLAQFEASRHRLQAMAYRLLGSTSEAEDAVQETYLRWQAADRDRIEVPQAWLTKVLTNLCLSELASARSRREIYAGQWLPEPLLEGDPMLGPAETVEQKESITYAVMVLLERLSPQERAVYVLREAFGHRHREIAEILDITEESSKQLAHRARQHLAAARSRTVADPEEAAQIVDEFLAAATSGRLEPLLTLLSPDAIAAGDGGGKVPAAARPFRGGDRVAIFLRGLFRPGLAKRRLLGGALIIEPAVVNGGPGFVASAGDRVFAVVALQITEDGIIGVYSQANPDKLVRAAGHWQRAGRDHGRAHEIPL